MAMEAIQSTTRRIAKPVESHLCQALADTSTIGKDSLSLSQKPKEQSQSLITRTYNWIKDIFNRLILKPLRWLSEKTGFKIKKTDSGKQASPITASLTPSQKNTIINKLKEGIMDGYNDIISQTAIKAVKEMEANFYLEQKKSAQWKKLTFNKTITLADGKKYPLDKVLKVLNKKTMPKTTSVPSPFYDEEEKRILQNYQDMAQQSVVKRFCNEFTCKVSDDLQSGKLKLQNLDQQLAASPKTIKSEEFNLDYEERIKSGSIFNSGSDPELISEYLTVEPEKDTHLQANIKALKAKIESEKAKLSHDPNKRELQLCILLKKHIQEAFPVNFTDSREIFESLTNYQRQSFIGDYLAPGIGVSECRHQALLSKILGDELGLKVSLKSGELVQDLERVNHAWNTVKIGDTEYLLDAYNNLFIKNGPTTKKYYFPRAKTE